MRSAPFRSLTSRRTAAAGRILLQVNAMR